MKFSKYILGALALAILHSCSGLLDIEQHGVMKNDNYYQTDQDALEATTTIYSEISGLEMYYFVIKNALSDDFWAGADAHAGDPWRLNDYVFDSSLEFLEAYFPAFYSIIGKCNLVLDNVSDDTPFKKQMRAEARVIRAWMYLELAMQWGNPPLVEHILAPSQAQVGNSQPGEVYAFVEKELKTAIESGHLVQKTSRDDNSNYRVTREYAQALLGKAYLWDDKPAEAAEALEPVVNSPLYDLFPGEYEDIFMIQNENNCEMMFESNVVDDPENPGSCLRFYPLLIGLRGAACYTFTENALGLADIGWGEFSPRSTLYQAFVDEEGVDGYRLNQSIKTYQFLRENGYVLLDGVQLPIEGYYMWKNRTLRDAVESGSLMGNVNNIRWMRFSEVLLLAAEANLAAGNQEKADAYLNRVRTRAKLPFKTATLDAIKTEKRLELFGEGTRWLDLVRWGDAKEVLKDQGKVYPMLSPSGVVEWKSANTDYGFKENRHERLPYPASEIRMNKNLIQNNGY